ncbi:MAG: D-aminopeptidase [Gemmatimonadaceae bacterium]|nr:D-aminopeptidase [Gemmatimonadaceae bacterium]
MTPTFAFALALSMQTALASGTRQEAPPATLSELEIRIRHLMDSTRTPGMGLAIVRHDSVIYTGGFGLARVSPPLPATASTLFRIGSTSKAFVAIVALQLQREGKLSLDDPIARHLPGFRYENPWEATDPVRIVHLLEHTSGFDDISLKGYANSDPTPLALVEGLAVDTTSRVSRWRPGTRYAYCNTGPAIVALIVERIEGRPFEQVVQQRVFDPIGMRTATYFFPDSTQFERATTYREDGTTPYPYWHIVTRPAGSINASALDMAQYVRLLLSRGALGDRTLLTREDVERMERATTSIGARAGLRVGYGLHLYRIADTSGFTWTGHDGGVPGGLSEMSYLPEAGVGYAVQINTADAAAFRTLNRIIRSFLTQSLPRPGEPPAGSVPPSIAARFRGWYEPVSPRTQHLYFAERLLGLSSVSFVGDTMLVKPVLGVRSRLLAVDSMRFRRHGESEPTVALVNDANNGREQGMETFGPALPASSMKRIPTALALGEIALTALWLLGLVSALIAGLTGLGRWVWRRIRRKPRYVSGAQPLWRAALLLTGLVVLDGIVLTAVDADPMVLGRFSPASATLYGIGIAYAAVALAGLALVIRSRPSGGSWLRYSLWPSRAVLALHLVAAAYLVSWGFIGWRTWV